MRNLVAVASLCVLGLTSIGPTSPASASAAKTVIKDPKGDANVVGDQRVGDVSSVADITSVRFSSDRDYLYVTINTVSPPPATQQRQLPIGFSVIFDVIDAPLAGQCKSGYVSVNVMYPGPGSRLTAPWAFVSDGCSGKTWDVRVTGTTVTIPRRIDAPVFGPRATLKGPSARSFLQTDDATFPTRKPDIDTTAVGKNYTFSN